MPLAAGKAELVERALGQKRQPLGALGVVEGLRRLFVFGRIRRATSRDRAVEHSIFVGVGQIEPNGPPGNSVPLGTLGSVSSPKSNPTPTPLPLMARLNR